MNARWKIFALTASSLLIGALLLFGGCSNHDGNEWQRLVCEVSQINDGAPLVSGYVDAGQDRRFPSDDDFLPIDYVKVAFHARAYNQLVVLPEDAPHSYFHITEYDLIWTPLTAGADSLSFFNLYKAKTDLLVPVNETSVVNVLVADRYMKEFDFFHDLAPANAPYYGRNKWPFMAQCELIFRGHETGNNDVYEVRGALMVSFVGVVVRQD